MGLFNRNRIRDTATTPLPPVGDNSEWMAFLTGRGYNLTPDAALQVSAVFRCVDIISKTMASMPFNLYKRTTNGKEKAVENPLYRLTYIQPNRYTTAFDFMQMFVTNFLLTRGAFAKIERNPSTGRVIGLWNIPTRNVSDVHTNTVTGEHYVYVYDKENKYLETLREGDYVFVPNFRFSDTLKPEDPMRIAGEVLGLTNNLNRFAQKTFTQGINPGGTLETPNGLSDVAYNRLKEDFEKNYAGVNNAGKYIILEEGITAKRWENDLEKGQVLESRKWAVTEICRLFGVPPHLCMDMEHATFSNIEQQSLEYVRDCINPLSVRIEQGFYIALLNDNEKQAHYWKFNTNALLRGDTQTRGQYYNQMRQSGLMNADEIRELEDMPPIPGGLGETYYINGNMLPLENALLNKPKSAQGGATK